MLKFFRKIRFKLIRGSKTAKYLKYAVGEIILVVIGILIAVGINSLYNKSQNEAKINTILKQVQQDLIVDINDAKRIYDVYIEKDSLYRKIINDTSSFENFQKNPYPLQITGNYVSFSNKKGGYKRVVDNIENLPEDYNFLLPYFNLLYIEMQNDIDDYNTFIKNTAMIGGKELNSKYPRFAEYQLGRYPKEAQRVYYNDPGLKNHTFFYINDLRNISQAANSYRIQSIKLYKAIDSLLNSQPDDYKAPLSVLPNAQDYKSYLGEYKNILGDTRNKLNIVNDNGQLVFEQLERDNLKIYWHKGEYYYSDFGIIIRLFTNKTGDKLMEVRTNVMREIYKKI